MSVRRATVALWCCALLVITTGVARLVGAQQVAPIPPHRDATAHPLICQPGTCVTFPPTVTLSPSSQTVSTPTITITATVCDSVQLDIPRSVIANGSDVTASLTA